MDSTDTGTDHKTQRSSGLPWVLFFLTLGLAAAAVYFGYGLLEDEKNRNAQALKASEDAVARARELEAKLAGSEAALTGLAAEKSALAAERDALSTDLKAKEEELAKLKATYDSLNEKLTAEIADGSIKLTQTGERIQVDLLDKILFDSGKAEVSAKGQEVLSRLGAAIANVDNKLIQVSGHTDDSPPVKELTEVYPTNWELSASRAVNVVRYLSEKGNVPSRRLVAAGFGQFHPVSHNRDHAGRARNRRIEVLLMPVLDPKPSDTVKVSAAKASSKGTTKAASAPAKKSKGR